MTNEELQKENKDLRELLKLYTDFNRQLIARVDELTLKILE